MIDSTTLRVLPSFEFDMARFASSVPTCPLREKATDQDRFLKAEKEKFMKTKIGNRESGEICYHSDSLRKASFDQRRIIPFNGFILRIIKVQTVFIRFFFIICVLPRPCLMTWIFPSIFLAVL